MSRKKRHRKSLGHYCWCCGCRRPNEKFSGKGHQRHLCKDCSKRDAKELAYFQSLRDLERCATLQGVILPDRREQFETFLTHDDPRIRELAEDMLADDSELGGMFLE